MEQKQLDELENSFLVKNILKMNPKNSRKLSLNLNCV